MRLKNALNSSKIKKRVCRLNEHNLSNDHNNYHTSLLQHKDRYFLGFFSRSRVEVSFRLEKVVCGFIFSCDLAKLRCNRFHGHLAIFFFSIGHVTVLVELNNNQYI